MATPETSENFVRVRRGILDHLIDGKLGWDEFNILLMLILRANPTNGIFITSYDSLVSDTRGHFSKNHINKIMLALKKQNYITFPNHRGSRTSIKVAINKYPLSNRYYTDFDKHKSDEPDRSSEETPEEVDAEVLEELFDGMQNFEEQKQRLTKGFSMDTEYHNGRTFNNKNENKEKEIIVSHIREEVKPKDFFPSSYEEERCRDYALELGEADMRFILSARRKYGFNRVEQAFNLTMEANNVSNRGAYFNKIIKELGEQDD